MNKTTINHLISQKKEVESNQVIILQRDQLIQNYNPQTNYEMWWWIKWDKLLMMRWDGETDILWDRYYDHDMVDCVDMITYLIISHLKLTLVNGSNPSCRHLFSSMINEQVAPSVKKDEFPIYLILIDVIWWWIRWYNWKMLWSYSHLIIHHLTIHHLISNLLCECHEV